MKKINYCLSLVLVLTLILTGVFCQENSYASSRVKKYETYICYVKTFKKYNGKIIIKTVTDTQHDVMEDKPFSIKFKPARNIKYTFYNAGESHPYKKTTFKNMKKIINSAYAYYKKHGTFDSPAGINIYVKNKRIIEIRLIYS